MAATDDFSTFAADRISSARTCLAITPHDTNELTHITAKGVLVGTAGNITGILADMGATTILLTGLLAGVHYPYAFRLIKSTGTTAGALTGFY